MTKTNAVIHTKKTSTFFNCFFCLVNAKITCQCHVRSESVMIKHADTRFRKRIGDIEITRRRFTLILSMSVQHPRLRSNFQCVSSRISLKRFNELSYQSKVLALFKSDDLIKRSMISRQSDVDTHWILHYRSPIICDDFSSSSALENVEYWWTLWITVLYLMTYTWRLEHWSDRDDICMTDRSCMRSISLQGCLLFSLPSTSNKFENLSLRQESLLRDFLFKKSET